MKDAIQKAIEGGWKATRGGQVASYADAFLDPLFWQALEKWRESKNQFAVGGLLHLESPSGVAFHQEIPRWQYTWLRFTMHLAEGKDAEEFFTNLLK